MLTVFEILGLNFVLVFTMMTLLWGIYVFRKNAGIVDIGWGIGFVVTVWVSFILGDGNFLRRLLIAVLVSIWGVRLSTHIIRRYIESSEDPRYQKIREIFAENSNIKFLMLYLFQGFLIVLLSAPFYVICLNERGWSWIEGVGVLIWILGILGETFADEQLRRFKKDFKNQDKVCKTGLWRISRHPNYFFEWVIWIGYFLIALPGPGGWITVISPLIIFYLLTQVSGIPPNEAESIRTKGEAYKAYQKTTSSFFPWFSSKP